MTTHELAPESRRLWESHRDQYELVIPEERVLWNTLSQESRDCHISLVSILRERLGILAKVRITDTPQIHDFVLYHEASGRFVEGEIAIRAVYLRVDGVGSYYITQPGKTDEKLAEKVSEAFEELAQKQEVQLSKLVGA